MTVEPFGERGESWPHDGAVITDHWRTKIALSAGLLAVLFAAAPLATSWSEVGFDVLRWRVSLGRTFLVMVAALGLALYLYAASLVFREPPRVLSLLGDLLYAVTLIVPPAVIGAWLLVLVGNWLGKVLDNQDIAGWSEPLVAAIASALAFYAWIRTARSLRARTEEAEEKRLEGDEARHFAEAKVLLSNGHYDSAVIEAYKSLEAGIRRAFRGTGRIRYGPRKDGVISALLPHLAVEDRKRLDFLRRLRNLAAHGAEPMSREQASEVLKGVSALHDALAALDAREQDA